MGLYIESEVINELKKTNSCILKYVPDKRNYDSGIYNSDIEGADFFLGKLLSLWQEFYRLVENNNISLDNNTKFSQRNHSVGMFFTEKDFMDDNFLFVSRLVEVLYEYYFWTNNVSYQINNKEIDKLIQYYEYTNHNVQDLLWVRDNMQYALMRWVLTSERFIEAKDFLANLRDHNEAVIRSEAARDAERKTKIEQLTKESLSSINNSFNTIVNSIKKDAEEVKQIASDIGKSLDEVRALEERVSKLRTEYNFVGLSSGFSQIKDKKEEELRNSEVAYKNLFGCMFICPLILLFLHVVFPEKLPQGYNILQVILPFVTIEMVMLYFFRLSYLEAKSLRAQLLQIDLKLSLCSFIDNYVKYRKEHNTNVKKVLDSFDSVIFSPIQANENNIPSMFDGMEALANLADKIIKK
ncbi:hypothetical protein NFJ16_12770 [Citrobacter freundii]|uniref:hypothetical protein n=1 Tax=Citrobacter freundii TaxID=546 RepID=UPI002431EA85|nr:hypothetical protein [Citrobacter freundii]WFU93228.1 hypothetical protein NFJ16_12770 [Citrobacter freundii]